MSLLTLLVPIDLQNIFHACMVFSLQRSAALQTVMCCCSSEKPRQSVEQAAVLGWALPLLEHSWFPSPRYKCLYLFGREYLPLLLFHTISTPKLVNKTCYSNSNQSLHGQLFFFPSLFLHSAAGGLSNGAMGSHQREEQPHLPQSFLPVLRARSCWRSEWCSCIGLCKNITSGRGKKENYFSQGVNTVTQFYLTGILTNSMLEEGKKKYRKFFLPKFLRI